MVQNYAAQIPQRLSTVRIGYMDDYSDIDDGSDSISIDLDTQGPADVLTADTWVNFTIGQPQASRRTPQSQTGINGETIWYREEVRPPNQLNMQLFVDWLGDVDYDALDTSGGPGKWREDLMKIIDKTVLVWFWNPAVILSGYLVQVSGLEIGVDNRPFYQTQFGIQKYYPLAHKQGGSWVYEWPGA